MGCCLGVRLGAECPCPELKRTGCSPDEECLLRLQLELPVQNQQVMKEQILQLQERLAKPLEQQPSEQLALRQQELLMLQAP
jgi:hypothetical protein